MIGLIVTGHGNFGTGITSSINLIAGKQENYEFVDFDGDGTEKLENDLKVAFDKLSATCEGIIVFSDLAGGSPFKTSVILSQNYKNVRVISGSNLPMLCEIAVSRGFIDDINMLVETALRVGKDGVQEFEFPKVSNGPVDGEEGI